MKASTMLITLWILFQFSIPESFAQTKSDSFESVIQATMKKRHVPGSVTAVYYQDSLVFSRTYGVKNVKEQTPVDRHTIFNLGSATKPLIGIAMGILVEQGKLNWEDRVKDHYPDFKLSDPYITNEARIKDLFTHNLGYASEDLLWLLDSTSTKVLLERYALADKIHPLRATFEYNNLMYVIAGEVIGAISGQHWTDFIQANVFEPLEMDHTFARAADVVPYGNYATPYMYENNQWISHPINLSDQMGAAGNIWSCQADMEHLLEFLVNEGRFRNKQLITTETFRYLTWPHVIESLPQFDDLYTFVQPNFRTYGMGWFLHDYRGEKVVFHPGSMDGMNAQIGVVPSKKLAFFTLTNRDWAGIWRASFYKAIDLWAYDDDSRNFLEAVKDPFAVMVRDWEEHKAALKDPDDVPKITVKDLEGFYSHPMYGSAEVTSENSKLKVIFNHRLTFHLEHWYWNSYLGKPQGRYYDLEDFFEFKIKDGNQKQFEVFGEIFLEQE